MLMSVHELWFRWEILLLKVMITAADWIQMAEFYDFRFIILVQEFVPTQFR